MICKQSGSLPDRGAQDGMTGRAEARDPSTNRLWWVSVFSAIIGYYWFAFPVRGEIDHKRRTNMTSWSVYQQPCWGGHFVRENENRQASSTPLGDTVTPSKLVVVANDKKQAATSAQPDDADEVRKTFRQCRQRAQKSKNCLTVIGKSKWLHGAHWTGTAHWLYCGARFAEQFRHSVGVWCVRIVSIPKVQSVWIWVCVCVQTAWHRKGLNFWGGAENLINYLHRSTRVMISTNIYCCVCVLFSISFYQCTPESALGVFEFNYTVWRFVCDRMQIDCCTVLMFDGLVW